MYEDEEEEEDKVVAEVIYDEDGAAANNRFGAVPSLSVIWDSDKVEKLLGGQWKCFHCVPCPNFIIVLFIIMLLQFPNQLIS